MQPKDLTKLLLGMMIAGIPLVAMADFTVQSGQTVGSQTLNSGDTGTVQSGGTISTTANNDHAIDGSSANNTTVSNSGNITSSGDGSSGIVVNDNNTITNGGAITTNGWISVGIEASDNNTINNSGSITTSGDNGFGISSNNSNNIINSGTITTNGTFATGISGNTNNSITNSGNITTTGFQSEGISSGNGSNITNSGGITTDGDDSDGISAGMDSTISNSSNITTAGTAAEGIFSGDNSVITNSGTINTTGDLSQGIETGSNSNIINTSNITTSGNFSHGIEAGTGGIITNSGSITTNGIGANGIYSSGTANITNSGSIVVNGVQSYGIITTGDNSTITNSGTIISDGLGAIELSGDNNTVNLLGGTIIQGDVLLARTTNNFNYGNGLNSVLSFGFNLPGSINSNGMPQATSGNLVATVDTTGFAIEDEVVTDITECGHNSIGLRLDRARYSEGEDTWGNLCGNMRQQQDSGPAVEASHLLAGAAFGRDHALSSDRRFGWMIGFSTSRVEVQYDAQEIDVKSLFGGIYGGRQLDNGNFINLSLLAGYADHNSDRHVVNNMVEGGLETARADYQGYFVSPSIRIGTNTQLFGLNVRPSLDISYTGMRQGSYSESGSDANVTADSRTLQTLSTRAKLSFLSDFSAGDGRTIHQESYIGLAGRTNLGDDNASIELLGSNIDFDYGGEDSSISLIAGFNATLIDKKARGRVVAGFDGQLDRDGSINLSAHINAVIPF